LGIFCQLSGQFRIIGSWRNWRNNEQNWLKLILLGFEFLVFYS
jgi:hypothetical protein